MADEEVGTPEKEPATLRDSLITAMKEGGWKDLPETKPIEKTGDQPAPAQETASGKPEEGKTDEEGTPSPDLKEPPAHWSDTDKATYKTLPPEAQEYLARRDKEMTADYTKKTTELADARKFHDELSPVLKQYDAHLKSHGVTAAQALPLLFNAQMAMDRDPKDALKRIGETYGVKVNFGESQADKNIIVDPELESVKKQLDDLKGQLSQQQRTAQASNQADVVRRIEAFQTEKDATGQPKYPHFDKVQDSMAKLIQSGLATDLPSAYDKAVRADDELYGQTIKAKEEAALKARDEESRKQTDEAKKRGFNVKGTNKPQPANKPQTLRDELEKQFAAQV